MARKKKRLSNKEILEVLYNDLTLQQKNILFARGPECQGVSLPTILKLQVEHHTQKRVQEYLGICATNTSITDFIIKHTGWPIKEYLGYSVRGKLEQVALAMLRAEAAKAAPDIKKHKESLNELIKDNVKEPVKELSPETLTKLQRVGAECLDYDLIDIFFEYATRHPESYAYIAHKMSKQREELGIE
tara:strand:+ start:401 stop:964 length:564 start_codon:yes stop_codon:yes gene_type:complete